MIAADLAVMERHLLANVPSYPTDKARLITLAATRASGHVYSIDEYVEGMIRAILTNSVPWNRIAPHITGGTIAAIFHGYSATTLLTVPYMSLVTGLRTIRCGNRSIVLQMRSLAGNIRTLQTIITTYGSIENYFNTLCPGTYPAIPLTALADFEYRRRFKLGGMGIPLVCEFLKNMGFLIPKPDVHLKTFLGNDRMGVAAGHIATNAEVFSQIAALASASHFSIPEIDLIIWSYCANGYGEICTKTPHCALCPFNRLTGGPCHRP